MQKHSNRSILVLTCLVFLALGLMTAALGPMLPDLAKQTGSTLAAIGSVFTALFLGALISQIISGPLGDRLGMGVVLWGGMVLLAVGSLGVCFSPWLPLTLALAFLAGLGHGAVDLGANLLVATAFGEKNVSAVNLLNMFFGVGAFVGPVIASVTLRLWSTAVPAMWVSAIMLLLLLPFLNGLRSVAATATAHPQPAVRVGDGIYRSPLLWLLGGLILTYVGTEAGIGGWTTTYMVRTTPLLMDQAAMVTAGFWLALTAGRMVSAAIGLRVPSVHLLGASLMGATLGAGLLVVSLGVPALSIAAVLLIGFSFGSVYPTVMAIIASAFVQGPGKAASVVAAMGSVGGMVLPWLQGIVLTQVSPRASAGYNAVGTVLMVGLLAAIWARFYRKTEKPAPKLAEAGLPSGGK
jgi:fucose permease